MYNEKILSQLNELKYLHVIKKSNISVMSKKNSFHDMVKFYAQINKEDVVQKISYKATGCTHFIVFCNHFCTLVEGKKVKDALKVNEQKLEEFVELDESRKHILKIIIDTFALLIKKYRKGVEKGIIEPVEVSEESNNESIVSVKNTQVVEKKINSITKEHKDIEYIKDAKIKIKKEKKSQKAKMIVVDDDITEDVVVNNTQEKVETKKTSKTNKKVEKDNKEKKEVKSTKTKKDEKSENKKSVNKSTVDNREEVKSKENKSDLNSKSKKLKITNESKNSEVVSVVEDKPKALKLIKEDKKVAPKTKKSSQKVQSETKVKSSKNKVSTKSNVNKNEETQEEVEIQKIDDTNLQTENLDQNNEVAIAMTDVEIIEPETEVQPSELQPIQKQTVVVERTEKYYKREVNINHNSLKQADNIIALQSMVQSSKSQVTHTEPQKQVTKTSVSNLSMMIKKLNKAEEHQEDENVKRLHNLSDNLTQIRNQNAIEKAEKQKDFNNTTQQSKESKKKKVKESKVDKKEKFEKDLSKEDVSKKKKGLFGWLKK